MTEVELINRTLAMSAWLEENSRNHPFYAGVLAYYHRLMNLCYPPESVTKYSHI